AGRGGNRPPAAPAAPPGGAGERGLTALLHHHPAGTGRAHHTATQDTPSPLADQDADVIAAVDPAAVQLRAAPVQGPQRREPRVGDLRVLETAPPVVRHDDAV